MRVGCVGLVNAVTLPEVPAVQILALAQHWASPNLSVRQNRIYSMTHSLQREVEIYTSQH